MNWKDRITVDPKVLVGKPIIRGTRISVELLMERLADGWSMEQILESYPRITREDVLATIAFVTEVVRDTNATGCGTPGTEPGKHQPPKPGVD